MIKTILAFASLPALALLTACSSGGDGGNSAGSVSFADMAGQANALLTRVEDYDLTPVADMPTDIKATYRGVAGFSDVADADYIVENAEIMSEVEMNADFRTGSVTGELSNFRYYDNDRIDGTVAIRNGSINGNDLRADLSGNLNYGEGTERVTGDLAGSFGWARRPTPSSARWRAKSATRTSTASSAQNADQVPTGAGPAPVLN